jgi:hypothetical protein
MLLGPIYYKEFIKIRWPWSALMALNGLLMAYILIDTRRLFILDHAEIVWYRVIHLNHLYYVIMKYAPLITGLLLAAIQYLPEMVAERLRLSLHLPVSPHRLILAHILVGLTAASLVIVLDLASLTLITARFFPLETVVTALLTALPWCLAGLTAYLGATLGLLEPTYRLKFFKEVAAEKATQLKSATQKAAAVVREEFSKKEEEAKENA